MRNEKSENINGYQCKVYTANNFELVTRTRIEHMSADDRKAHEAGSSNRNILGGVFNFLESSASSSSKSTTASATPNPSAIKSSNVGESETNIFLILILLKRINQKHPIKHLLHWKNILMVESI
jgi:hypothetical protein